MIPDAVLDFLSGGLLDLPVGKVVLITLAMTHFTIAAVTIYLHRHQAHRALDLHPLPSHIFRLWLWLSTGMQTKDWAAIHRKHHAKCETPDDPHSPQTRGIKTVFWKGAELYRAEAKNKETLERFGHGTPDDWIEHNVYSRFVWQGAGLMLIIDWLLFGVLGTTVWAVQMIWIPLLAAGVINGIGHYWGYRNFNCEDASTNIFPWGLLIGGEELHNNHHTYPTSAKLSVKWYEFDIGWVYIRILSALGLATVKKVAPTPKQLAEPRAEVDQATVQAVIAYRYDIMAGYARSLKRVYREEMAHLRAASADRLAAAKLARMKMARKWLNKDTEQLADADRAVMNEALASSQKLAKLYEMRAELAAIWKRRTSTADQLRTQLQDWCKRAEESGIRALQEFSLRLRSYA